MKLRILACLTAGVLAAGTAALAEGTPPSASIPARQASYRETGAAFKTINDELRKSAPGRFAMASSARQIEANLRQVAGLFPAGSGPASGVKTKARAVIWSNRAGFDQANVAAVRQADLLVAAMRGTDIAAIRRQTQALGRSCKACHDTYRIDE